jgi:DNA-directed RNA polymerase subunit RPC12/RpoP
MLTTVNKCFKCSNAENLFNFDNLLKVFKCRRCGTKFEVDYDEVWDGENEHQYWGFKEL